MKQRVKRALLLALFTPALVIAETNLPSQNNVPGGIAIVPLAIESDTAPLVRFGNRRVLVAKQEGSWFAVVGLSCETLPGSYILQVSSNQSNVQFIDVNININSPTGASSLLPIREVLHSVTLYNPAMRTDLKVVKQSYSDSTPKFEFNAAVEPIEVVGYGKFARNQGVVRHAYISYISRPAAQVYSPASGKVLAITFSEKDGNTVYLDHGSGVISALGHLQEVSVEENQFIDDGEHIGTGKKLPGARQTRVDWGLIMNGYFVNPLQFTSSS